MKAGQTRERILNCAIQEFSLQGYSKASTNRTMEQSGITKVFDVCEGYDLWTNNADTVLQVHWL